MKKLFSFFQRKLPLLLILILGLVPLGWFKNNLLIIGGDLPIPLAPAGNFIKSFLYLWYPYLYGGEPNPHIFAILPWFGFWSLLKSIGFSLLTIDKLWFIFVFILSGLSMYYLVSVLFKEKVNSILLFVPSLFYMFNVYIMVVTPTMATPLLYGALPLILGLYIRGLNRSGSSTKYAVLVALSTLLICSVIGNPPIYAILGIMMLSYLVYHLVIQGKSQIIYSLIFTFKIGIFYFLLNFWWLYPYFINTLVHSTNILKFANPGLNFGSSLLSDTFRLLGSWAFYAKTNGAAYFPFAHYYKTPFFIILTFLIPIMAFASVFFKFNKKVLYFLPMAVLGILLASGSYLGINKLLFSLIPGFWIFREPFAKFTAITAISFAVLIGFSTSNFFDFIKKHKSKNLSRLYLIGVILVILISSWPILTGDLIFSQRGWMASSHVEIPDYWFKTGNWFNDQKGDFRILVLPENPVEFYAGLHYKWGYASGDITPYLIHQPLIEEHAGFGISGLANLSTNLTNVLYDKIRNFEKDNFNVKTLLQILNVKYILQRNDVAWGLILSHPSLFSPNHLQEVLSSEKYLSKDKSLGDLDFYRISEESFLPHFYIPQNIIYSNGNLEDIPNITSFGDLNIRSAIFFPSLTKNNDSKKSISQVDEELKNPIEKADDIFVKAEIENPITKDEIGEWNGRPIKETVFPYVRWQPGSFQYYFVLKKEEFDKWISRGNPNELFSKQLFYAAKRVSEMEKWQSQMTNEKRKEILMTYKKEIYKAFNIVEKKIASGVSASSSLMITERFLMDSQKKIEEAFGESQMVETVFEELKGKLGQLKPKRDFLNVKYNVDLPRAGDYEIFLKGLEIEKLKNWEILGEKTGTESSKLSNDGWIELGERNFKEREHQIVLNLNASDNLIGDDWQNFRTTRLKSDKLNFNLQNFFSTELSIDLEEKNKQTQISIPNGSSLENGLVFQEIKRYSPNSLYRINFDYLAEYGNAKLAIVQDSDIDKETGKISPLIEKELPKVTKGQWENVDLLIKSESGVKAATIYLFAYPEEKTIAHIEFKNMKVEEIFEPTIVLRARNREITETLIPKITFVKINPTKYRVKVEGAKNPYILVFSESFHKEWKAYINNVKCQNSNIKCEDEYKEVTASYFNDEIKEATHKDIFLDKDTFETWRKKPVPESSHLLVNGYANSWYITPGDSGGRQDYEIIIEFWPQRLFYLGLAISLITFLSVLGYLGYFFLKGKV